MDDKVYTIWFADQTRKVYSETTCIHCRSLLCAECGYCSACVGHSPICETRQHEQTEQE